MTVRQLSLQEAQLLAVSVWLSNYLGYFLVFYDVKLCQHGYGSLKREKKKLVFNE